MQPAWAIIVSWREAQGTLLPSAPGDGWKRHPNSTASFGSLCSAFASEMVPLQVKLVMLRASSKVDLCGENLWLFTDLFAFLTTGGTARSKEARFSKIAQNPPSKPPRRNSRMGKVTQNWAPQTPQQAGLWLVPSGDGHWWAPVGHQSPAKPWNLLGFCSPQKWVLLLPALTLHFPWISCTFPVRSRAPPSQVRGFLAPCCLPGTTGVLLQHFGKPRFLFHMGMVSSQKTRKCLCFGKHLLKIMMIQRPFLVPYSDWMWRVI